MACSCVKIFRDESTCSSTQGLYRLGVVDCETGVFGLWLSDTTYPTIQAAQVFLEQTGHEVGACPIGTLQPCTAGPTFIEATNITPTSATIQFNGLDVFELRYIILDSMEVVLHSADVAPTSALIPITYPTLSPGTYTIKLQGVTCEGESTGTFTVPA